MRTYEPYPSVIRSRVRMDYGAADALLREGEPDGAALDAAARGRAELAVEAARANGVDLRAFLRNADALARARREIRRKRGSIDFDTPEVHVLLDEAGMPVDIVTRERTAATSLVEEAMLLANECVAEFLADRDLVSALSLIHI